MNETTEGLLERFGRRSRARHADQRTGHLLGAVIGAPRPGCARSRLSCLGLLRGRLGHGGERDRQDALHHRRPGVAVGRDRTATGPMRFGAQHSQSVRTGQSAIPRSEGRRRRRPGRRARTPRRLHPRPRPGDLCEHKALFAIKGEVPDGEHVEPLGAARIVREGSECTIVALAAMVPRAAEAAERLATEHGISAEVIDLRCLVPLDTRTILASVEKTSRLFTVEENPRLCGWGAEIVSLVADEAFYSLDAPLVRIARPCPAARRRRARGSGHAIGGSHRGHDPAQARGGAVITVGVVGTGRMGSAMARSTRPGWPPLVLYNRTRARADALADELGARVVATPAQAAAGADVILTMLADDAAVDDVYRGPDGLLAGARQGSVLVDLSTCRPGTIRSFEAQARDAAIGLLDAPVSGSVTTAESGRPTVMVGGEAADLERARPALEPVAGRIFHMGDLGSGAAMKLAVNAVILGLNGALAEGLVLAEAAGVDRTLAYDVIAASAAGAPFVGYKRAAFLKPDVTPTAFALELAEKDLRLITELADALGIPAPQARTNLEILRATQGRWPAGPGPLSRGRAPAAGTGDSDQGIGQLETRRKHRGGSHTDQGGHAPDAGSDAGRACPRGHPRRGRQDRAGGNEPRGGRRQRDRRHRRHRHPGLHRHPPPHLGDVDPDVRARLHAGGLFRGDPGRSSRPSTGPRTSMPRTSGVPSSPSTQASRRSSTGRTS